MGVTLDGICKWIRTSSASIFNSLQGRMLLVPVLLIVLLGAVTLNINYISTSLGMFGVHAEHEPIYNIILNIFIAIGTVSVVILALFQDWNQKAKLEFDHEIILRENVGSHVIVELQDRQSAVIDYLANYYKLKVVNVGPATAKNVYAKLSKIKPLPANFSYEGTRLSWSGPENYDSIQLAKNDEAVLDIAYEVLKTKDSPSAVIRTSEGSEIVLSLEKLKEELVGEFASLDCWHLKVKDNKDGNLVSLPINENYDFEIIVYSDNSEPIKKIIKIGTSKMQLVE
ncbi:MAG: hypothetical protein WC821_01110 [archaeon]